MTGIFKESEDERIRREIIDIIKSQKEQQCHIDSTIYDKHIAWLKKQGEQTADKVEPKFNEGNFIKHNKANIICKVISVNSGSYYIENIETSGRIELFNAEQNFHLWTIQDAKDGDILIDKSNYRECPFIFKETKPSHIKTDVLNPLTILGYCGIGGAGFTKGIGWGDTANCTYYPATKEQRDLLFQKMKEAGYEWDADKKELKKIGKRLLDGVKRMNIGGKKLLTL